MRLFAALRTWIWMLRKSFLHGLRQQNLLRDPLKAEFIFHVAHSGEVFLYSSKTDATQAELGAIVQGIIHASLTFAKNTGVIIEGTISNRQ